MGLALLTIEALNHLTGDLCIYHPTSQEDAKLIFTPGHSESVLEMIGRIVGDLDIKEI